jgi:outer membrane protein, adhesin transport system
MRRGIKSGFAVVACIVCAVGSAFALTLEQAVSVALDSNPEIGQAVENREAIEFELRQARGLYLPRIDALGSVGQRRLDSPGRRLAGIDKNALDAREIGGTISWKLFDGFGREAEIDRQASRVDGASFRVLERSEFIALAIAKEYFEIILQDKIVKIAEQNLAFHKGIAGRIREGVNGGSLTTADTQQAQERLKAAEARLIQARDDLIQARERFFKYVGMPPSSIGSYRSLNAALPKSLDAALATARTNNPQIKFAQADVDAAYALVRAARARYMPEVSVEGNARRGEDIDGVENRTRDLQARLVTKWNLFNGGIDKAAEQEQVRRLGEARLKLHQIQREVDEALRSSWQKRQQQAELLPVLNSEASFGKGVVSAYQEQFRAGRRTPLDVLSAQNTYVNTLILAEISRYAEVFAAYRVHASMGQLVPALGLKPAPAADAYARRQAWVPETPPAETMRRYSPDRSTGYGLNGWMTRTEPMAGWQAEVKK